MVSPLYLAVIVCEPRLSEASLQVAEPVVVTATEAQLGSAVVPSMKETVPVGDTLPEVAVILAVN